VCNILEVSYEEYDKYPRELKCPTISKIHVRLYSTVCSLVNFKNVG